jgi:hypothetical protein
MLTVAEFIQCYRDYPKYSAKFWSPSTKLRLSPFSVGFTSAVIAQILGYHQILQLVLPIGYLFTSASIGWNSELQIHQSNNWWIWGNVMNYLWYQLKFIGIDIDWLKIFIHRIFWPILFTQIFFPRRGWWRGRFTLRPPPKFKDDIPCNHHNVV